MEVVLKQDVDALGLRGEVVNVARGYARNFLLPRGLAEVATPGLLREIEKRETQRARHEAKSVDEARAIVTRLEALELRFDVNAGPTGSLFGSVTATNVADRLWDQEKLRVDRRKLQMDGIKRIGRYSVPFEVFPDVVAELKLVVAPEGQELPPEEELAALEAEEAAATAAAAAPALAEAEGPAEIEETVVEAEVASVEAEVASVEAEVASVEPEPAEPEATAGEPAEDTVAEDTAAEDTPQ